MPTLDTIRDAAEADLESLLKQLDDQHKAILRAAIKRYGVQDIPESIWAEMQRNIEEETTAIILMLLMMADDWTTEEIAGDGVARSRLTDTQKQWYSYRAAIQASDLAAGTTATVRSRLIRKIQDEALTGAGEIGTATETGVDRALDDVFTQSRRQTIAIDTTTQAMSWGQRGAAGRATTGDDGAAADGRKFTIALIWRTEKDNLVCPRCSPLEGQPEEVWGFVFPEGPGPDAHPNCVLPGQLACVPGFMPAATNSLYVGNCVEITCRSGRKLSVTADHKVFTGRGWQPAASIVKGDNLFAGIDAERIAAMVDPDNDHRPALIEEVFASLVMPGLVPSRRVPSTSIDLDGNFRQLNRQVDVKFPNGFLGSDSKARTYHPFAARDFQRRLNRPNFMGSRSLHLLAGRMASFSHCGMCGCNLEPTSIRGHAGPLHKFGFGLPSYSDTRSTQSSAESVTRYSELGSQDVFGLPDNVATQNTIESWNVQSKRARAGNGAGLLTAAGSNAVPDKHGLKGSRADATLATKFLQRFPSLIAADQVTHVRRFKYSGQVYDLQCHEYELFFCNGLIIHNCRCQLEPKVVFLTQD